MGSTGVEEDNKNLEASPVIVLEGVILLSHRSLSYSSPV
jgi:hypothetical protein